MRLKLMALIVSLLGIGLYATVLAQSTQHPETAGTFDIPFSELPGGRVNASGHLDPTSSSEDAHAGAFVAAKRLGLFKNFEWLHWLPTVPSK